MLKISGGFINLNISFLYLVYIVIILLEKKTWNYPSLIEHSSFDDISYDDLELLNLFYGYELHLV